MDYYGMDYQWGVVTSWLACSDMCTADARCRAFTWTGGTCFLKEGIWGLFPNSDPQAVSGLAPTYEFGRDHRGGDYRSFTIPADRHDLCAAACARDHRCQTWTHAGAGTSSTCFLKSSLQPSQECSNCTSGVAQREFASNWDRPGIDMYSAPAESTKACGHLCARIQLAVALHLPTIPVS